MLKRKHYHAKFPFVTFDQISIELSHVLVM